MFCIFFQTLYVHRMYIGCSDGINNNNNHHLRSKTTLLLFGSLPCVQAIFFQRIFHRMAVLCGQTIPGHSEVSLSCQGAHQGVT